MSELPTLESLKLQLNSAIEQEDARRRDNPLTLTPHDRFRRRCHHLITMANDRTLPPALLVVAAIRGIYRMLGEVYDPKDVAKAEQHDNDMCKLMEKMQSDPHTDSPDAGTDQA